MLRLAWEAEAEVEAKSDSYARVNWDHQSAVRALSLAV